MALTVETGSGVAGADCYADVTACSAWAVAYYGSALAGNTADKEAAIRRATAYLDGLAWKGTRTLGRGQSLAWPRSDVTDCEGLAIASDEIPGELIFAQHVLARAEFQSPGVLSPSVSLAGVNRREKVDVIEVEYDTSRLQGNAAELRQIVTMAMDKLKCLLAVQPGGARVPWAVVV
jgi:hypothetical protein